MKFGACLRPELRPMDSRLSLHFDKLSVQRLSKEALLLCPRVNKGGFHEAEGMNENEKVSKGGWI
jgi:hypothetical protein